MSSTLERCSLLNVIGLLVLFLSRVCSSSSLQSSVFIDPKTTPRAHSTQQQKLALYAQKISTPGGLGVCVCVFCSFYSQFQSPKHSP